MSKRVTRFIAPLPVILIVNYIAAGYLAEYIRERFGVEVGEEEKGVRKVTKGGGVFVKRPALKDYLDPIVKRNIFDSSAVYTPPSGKEDSEEGPGLEGMERSDLNMELVGTIVAKWPSYSLAIMRDKGVKDSTPAGYSIGDRVQDREVFQIDRLRVIFKRDDGTLEYLELEEEGKIARPEEAADEGGYEPYSGIRKVSEDRYMVSEKDIEYAMNNLSKVATEARVIPHFERGQAVGFKLFAIKKNSFFKKAGFNNGDIVERINGHEINSPEKALQIYELLKNDKSISVDISRGGKKMTIDYEIR